MTSSLDQQLTSTQSSTSDEIEEQTNLTQNQLGFWLGQRVSSSASLYNMGQLFQLRGEIDKSRFDAAFQTLICRSDSLRTMFVDVAGTPIRKVAHQLHHAVPMLDFSADSDPDEALHQWCRDRISRRLNLAERCFDTALIKLGEARWAWYLCMHHLICDGTSMNLVFENVGKYYELGASEEPVAAHELPQFASYVSREKAYRASDACRRDAIYWESRLSDTCESLEYYGNRRSSVGANQTVRLLSDLSEQRSREILDVAQRVLGPSLSSEFHRLMAYIAVTGAYHLRVSESRRLVVGVPIHNRTSPSDRLTIGLMMEVVPLCLEIEPYDSFSDLLKKVQNEALAALRHYRYGCVNPERSKAYDILVNLVPPNAGMFAGLPASCEWLHSGAWNEAFTLQIQRQPHSVSDRLYFDLNSELFPGLIASRAIEHFSSLVDYCIEKPDQPILHADVLTDVERAIVSVPHFGAGRSKDFDADLLGMLGATFRRSQKACAVDDGATCLSYEALDAVSNRLAQFLRKKGVGPESIVGVCVERSARMVVALLGILKCGAGYLPMDPAFPPERLAFMLRDSGAKIVLTDRTSSSSLPSSSIDHVWLDSNWPLIVKSPDVALPSSGTGGDGLAYLIYTSGSTGVPKGVEVTRSNVANLLNSMAREPGLRSDDRLLAVTTLSFDISVLELFLPLFVGGTVAIASRAVASDGDKLAQLLEQQGISVMQATPATWRMLFESGWRGRPQLKALCGGEALPKDLARKLLGAVSEVWNMYGPTETTVWSTCCRIVDPEEPILIGKAIDNTTVKVLDGGMRPVPVGVYGELYIGGRGVARGYWNRPELTEQRFVNMDGTRYYRTGDSVRYREDGNLEYRNRVDNQIKLRGFRIELGEIEAILSEHAAISEAAVVVREDGPDIQHLVAYIVLNGGAEASGSQLREYLSIRLPSYMVPSAFIRLQAMPHTPNGKIDRKALPAPDMTTRLVDAGYAPPTTPQERALAIVWKEVLGLDRVGVDDNFFDLGGDSILAVKIASRASQAGLCTEAAEIFEAGCIRSLASSLAARDGRRAQGRDGFKSGKSAEVKLTDDQMHSLLAELKH